MIRFDDLENLLIAESLDEARTIAHASGPRQVGVVRDAGLFVYVVHPDGLLSWTHSPDPGYRLPAWQPREE